MYLRNHWSRSLVMVHPSLKTRILGYKWIPITEYHMPPPFKNYVFIQRILLKLVFAVPPPVSSRERSVKQYVPRGNQHMHYMSTYIHILLKFDTNGSLPILSWKVDLSLYFRIFTFFIFIFCSHGVRELFFKTYSKADLIFWMSANVKKVYHKNIKLLIGP